MTNQDPLTEKIKTWLLTHSFFKKPSFHLLLGDGSTRSFYRVMDESLPSSAILLSDPSWIQTQDYPAHQKALKEAGILVPEFFACDEKSGFLLMEDLGDTSLQKALVDNPQKAPELLKQAVEILAALHSGLFPVPETLPASKRRFDEEKLFDECLFTLEHLRKKYLGLPDLALQQKETIRNLCYRIASIEPLVFCHRDYHSRNLFLKNDQLFMIDFQDARLGPAGYDLASLLYDPYFPLDSSFRSQLVAEYQKRSSQALKDLELIAYQRVFKAAGSFASFYTRFQKDLHLQYLEPALLTLKTMEDAGQVEEELSFGFKIDELLAAVKGKKK